MNEQSLEGMTVNERLFHLNLFESFDAAAKSRDFEAMVQVLLQARLSEQQANETAGAILANPVRYGF
ncbi:hypothetical protein [Methylomicrobium lacus]|uniref:hypothetical protein n=1 Tax=Methylomicrobium lacus TaxID=136992 RepID=UPI00045E5919|nr:hypothetical protein [Methylomicrobium lacus]